MSIGIEKNMIANISSRVHPNCIVCSPANTKGLKLRFASGSDGSTTATFACHEALEGYLGVMHGGVISSILDGAMTHCMFARGKTAVTAEMSTRFRHPILVRQSATVSARIKRSSHPLYLLEAKIVQAGQVKATAIGKFLDQPDLLIRRHISHERVCLHNNTR